MKLTLLISALLITANGFICLAIGHSEGKVLGCQYAYRDLYTKYGIKHIDEDSLKSFCEKQ